MKIQIHIERLILDSLPVSAPEQVRKAVAVELERLIAADGISHELRRGGAVPSVRAGTLDSAARPSPRQLGRQIARAVYGGLRGPE